MENIVSEEDQREREFMAEERARRRFAAADEVTRIRTILVDKTSGKEDKKKAFHGAQYHSDMLVREQHRPYSQRSRSLGRHDFQSENSCDARP